MTPVPVVAETEPDISAFDPGAIEIPQRTLVEAPPVSSGGWAALAAAVALFASAAAGYTFITLQHAVQRDTVRPRLHSPHLRVCASADGALFRSIAGRHDVARTVRSERPGAMLPRPIRRRRPRRP